MNVIVNIEILIFIHKSTCQYALNAPYQYSPTQGAYYVQYDDEEHTKKRKSYIDYDISVRIDQKPKRLKCKCSFKYCKKNKKQKGCCCPYQQDNHYYNDYYSPDNKIPSVVYPPFSTISPYYFYTLPNNMFPPAFIPFPNFPWVTTTTANPTKTLSPSTEIKVTETKTKNTKEDGSDKDKDKDRDKDKDKDENKDKNKDGDEGNDNDIDKDKDKDRDKDKNITSKTTHKDVVTKSTIPYTIVSLKPSKLILKDISKIKPCRQRHCIRNDRKIGRYYHKDIIVRPTLSYPNRRK